MKKTNFWCRVAAVTALTSLSLASQAQILIGQTVGVTGPVAATVKEAVEGDRLVAQLHYETAREAVDAVTLAMPERPRYPAPAKTVMRIGAPTIFLDAAGGEVNVDGSPLAPGH